MAGIWDELGIVPTADTSLIRRAYAARLKAVRPDADPQGFARLRGAYERALAGAASPVPAVPVPVSLPVPVLAPVPVPAPARADATPEPAASAPIPTKTAPSEPDRQHPAPVHGATVAPPPRPAPPRPAPDPLAEHLRRGDVLAAADWLVASRRTGALTLSQDLNLADRLGWTMAQDRALPPQAVRAAAGRLGWPDDAASAGWAGALRARLDAERWLDALQCEAASRTRWLGATAPIAARVMLGRGGLGVSRLMARDPRLKRRYGEYWLHAPVVGDQFDPVRTEAIGRLMAGRGGLGVPKPLFIAVLLLAARGMGALAAQYDPRLQDGVTGVVAVILLLVLFNRHRWPWLHRTIERWWIKR